MIEWVLAWASDHRDQALWLIPVLAFMETCVGIGLLVPSLLLVIVCSVLYANGAANLWLMAGMALIGSSLGDHVGDHVGYCAGRALGPRSRAASCSATSTSGSAPKTWCAATA